MSEWDFQYGLDEQEEDRVRKRNKEWDELKELRDNNKISHEDFKAKKAEIFAYDNQISEEYKQYIRYLKKLSENCSKNRNELGAGVKCGCYYCTQIFTVYEIKEYKTDGTAICPCCGKENVLSAHSGGTNETLLGDMHQLFFPEVDLSDIGL